MYFKHEYSLKNTHILNVHYMFKSYISTGVFETFNHITYSKYINIIYDKFKYFLDDFRTERIIKYSNIFLRIVFLNENNDKAPGLSIKRGRLHT